MDIRKRMHRGLVGMAALALLAPAAVAAEPGTAPAAPGATKLSAAVAALKPGEWAAFDGPPKEIGAYGISWQGTTAYWDAGHREFQFMSKMQGGGAAHHWIYSEATGTWRDTVGKLVFGGGPRGLPGHIWCRAFDPTTGDYYYMDTVSTGNFVRIMKREIEAGQGSTNNPWAETSRPDFKARILNEEEIGYHPNLFGQEDGGLVLWGGNRLSVWRKKTDSWQSLMTYSGGDYFAPGCGTGQYLPGFDRLILGTGKKEMFMLFDAGKDGKVSTDKPPLEKAPIKIFGATSGHLPWGKLVVHPGDDKRLIILGPPPDYKVWTNAKGGTADGWVEEKYTHPFTRENVPMTGGDWGAWTCGSVSTHGVIWALACDGKTSKGLLWKPNN